MQIEKIRKLVTLIGEIVCACVFNYHSETIYEASEGELMFEP